MSRSSGANDERPPPQTLADAARRMVGLPTGPDRLELARQELERLSGPLPRAEVLAALDAAIDSLSARFTKQLRRGIEEQTCQVTAEPRPQELQAIGEGLLAGAFEGLDRQPTALLVAVFAPQLKAVLREVVGKMDYAGADGPPLKERTERRIELVKEIARLKREQPPPPAPNRDPISSLARPGSRNYIERSPQK